MKYHTIIAILIFSSILCTIIFQNANALEIELRNKKGELVYSEKNIAGYSFEIGPWAAPLVITNVILFSLVFLYHKKILPSIIRKLIMMIFKFEISRKVAFVCLAVLLIMYVGFSVNRLLQPPDQLPDYPLFLQLTKNWKGAISSDYAVNVRFVLSSISYYFLGNVRIVPFLESISLLLLSYYFTAQLSEKRFAGIISVVIILQSNLFWQYDTIIEDNSWTLFYLLSLVLIAKRQQYLSPI
ncbi:MAG: hypothetical protein KGI08_09950, partial [Thaumarchaeota archaeon]|nr:hypothetical protein [Nitrososphaerota archaeon]